VASMKDRCSTQSFHALRTVSSYLCTGTEHSLLPDLQMLATLKAGCLLAFLSCSSFSPFSCLLDIFVHLNGISDSSDQGNAHSLVPRMWSLSRVL
jgi:hypothetical protein